MRLAGKAALEAVVALDKTPWDVDGSKAVATQASGHEHRLSTHNAGPPRAPLGHAEASSDAYTTSVFLTTHRCAMR